MEYNPNNDFAKGFTPNADQEACLAEALFSNGGNLAVDLLRNNFAMDMNDKVKLVTEFSSRAKDDEAKGLFMSLQCTRSPYESSLIIRQLLMKVGTDCTINDRDEYGDGDQSPITTGEADAQIFRDLFANGGDIEHWLIGYPHSMSAFEWHCVNGNADGVEHQLKKTKPENRMQILEKRATSMRLTPLLLTIAMSKHPGTAHAYTGYPINQMDHVGVVRVLLKYGARPNAKDVTGKTACHYGAGSHATKNTLEMTSMANRATWTCSMMGKPVVLDGLTRIEYNGMKGILGGFDDESSRRVFHPNDPTKKEFLVKPENVFVLGKDNQKGCDIMDKSVRATNLVVDQDRIGSISLHEVVMSQRSDVAEFLLKRSSKCLDIKDCSGFSARTVVLCPVRRSMVNKTVLKFLQKTTDEEEAKQQIKSEKCEGCGISAKDIGKRLLPCSKCLDAVYCSKECQVADWKKIHKSECKLREKQGELVLGEPQAIPGHFVNVNFMSGKRTNHALRCRPPKGVKVEEKFWIKVQSNGMDHNIMIYDETRHCNFYLAQGSLGHRELVQAVSSQTAFQGKKSFFLAKINKKGKCVVFLKTSKVLKW